MALKKTPDAAAAPNAITGFSEQHTKFLAAAFVSSIGNDKYNYDLFAQLTGNTVGSVKKMWPPIKRSAAEAHPSLAAFLGGTEGGAAAKAKSNGAQKRKVAEVEGNAEEKGGADATADAAGGGEEGVEKGKEKGKTKANATKKRKLAPKEAEAAAAAEISAEGDASASAADAAQPAPEDRKPRGRPRKKTDTATTAADDASEKKPAARGGGGGKKIAAQIKKEATPVDAKEPAVPAAADAAADKKPAPRGRKKTLKPLDADAVKKESSPSPEAESEVENAAAPPTKTEPVDDDGTIKTNDTLVSDADVKTEE